MKFILTYLAGKKTLGINESLEQDFCNFHSETAREVSEVSNPMKQANPSMHIY